jgi:ProP effector
LSAGVEHKVAAAALSSHCNNPRYLMNMVEGATRVDLQGQPAGVVTAEEAARAQQRLAELIKPKRMPEQPAKSKVESPKAPAKPKATTPFRKDKSAGSKPVVVEVRRTPSWRSGPKRKG